VTADRPSGPIPGSYWVVPGRFAAGEYPGAREKLSLLTGAGIDFFVDLTEAGEYGLRSYEALLDGPEYRRIEVHDMGVPSVETMGTILDTIDRALAAGRTVYVHCYGGIGRTGTAVGCHLVRQGSSAEDALASIAHWRRDTPDAGRESPETLEQRRFVGEWATRHSTARR
jgi:protein-tyrosine phosphatase